MSIIKSLYTEHEFKMEVLGETKDEYIVRHLPQYQKQMAEGDSIHRLRKSMIRPSLYELIETKEPEFKQLDMFEMLGL